MIKIEASTLEEAYTQAATSLECSVTQLKIEVVQSPSKGLLGLFSKKAIIVAIVDNDLLKENSPKVKTQKVQKEVKQEQQKELKQEKSKQEQQKEAKQEKSKQEQSKKSSKPQKNRKQKNNNIPKQQTQEVFRDTIMPESFVSTQEDDDYDDIDSEDYEDEIVENNTKASPVIDLDISTIVSEVNRDINKLFSKTCFAINKIDVSAYDETTILVEFKGDDAALLIGKEGYRYKALSYMIFNWVNTKYKVQLRLEIAEFLKNQEESVSRYLEGIRTSIDRDGRAQTKILDGVLVQIALKELRESYPNKYVAIRTTRDGLKYIIVNDYNN